MPDLEFPTAAGAVSGRSQADRGLSEADQG
jgi:hypothetical protein